MWKWPKFLRFSIVKGSTNVLTPGPFKRTMWGEAKEDQELEVSQGYNLIGNN